MGGGREALKWLRSGKLNFTGYTEMINEMPFPQALEDLGILRKIKSTGSEEKN